MLTQKRNKRNRKKKKEMKKIAQRRGELVKGQRNCFGYLSQYFLSRNLRNSCSFPDLRSV